MTSSNLVTTSLGYNFFECWVVPLPLLFKNIFFFDVYLSLRERDRAWTREEQRDRETQNPKQAPGSEPSAHSLMWDLNSWTMRSWPEPKSDAQLTEPSRAPLGVLSIPTIMRIFLHLEQWSRNCSDNYGYFPAGKGVGDKGGTDNTDKPPPHTKHAVSVLQ